MTASTILPLNIGKQASPARGEVPDDWALATAHETGAILIWDPHGKEGIAPAIRLHPNSCPCRYLAVRSCMARG